MARNRHARILLTMAVQSTLTSLISIVWAGTTYNQVMTEVSIIWAGTTCNQVMTEVSIIWAGTN